MSHLKMHINYGGLMSIKDNKFSYSGGRIAMDYRIDPDLMTWSIFQEFMEKQGVVSGVEQVWYRLPNEDISVARSIYKDKDNEIRKMCSEVAKVGEVYVYIEHCASPPILGNVAHVQADDDGGEKSENEEYLDDGEYADNEEEEEEKEEEEEEEEEEVEDGELQPEINDYVDDDNRLTVKATQIHQKGKEKLSHNLPFQHQHLQQYLVHLPLHQHSHQYLVYLKLLLLDGDVVVHLDEVVVVLQSGDSHQFQGELGYTYALSQIEYLM